MLCVVYKRLGDELRCKLIIKVLEKLIIKVLEPMLIETFNASSFAYCYPSCATFI